jgi:hypothetical protein
MRNQKLVALQKNQSQNISKQTTKYKKESKEVDIDKLQSTNLGQRMSGVEEINCQSWDLVLLCESSQSPDLLVETLFL